jgi:hypothetical protein
MLYSNKFLAKRSPGMEIGERFLGIPPTTEELEKT